MLDHFSIFNRNGVMLWSEQLSQDAHAGESVNDLVRYVLLEERAVSTYDSGKYQLKWALANELDLVFVVVFNKLFAKTLDYLDELLLAVKQVRASPWHAKMCHVATCADSAGLPCIRARSDQANAARRFFEVVS